MGPDDSACEWGDLTAVETAKHALRERVWDLLEREGIASARGRIPEFVAALLDAEDPDPRATLRRHLAQVEAELPQRH